MSRTVKRLLRTALYLFLAVIALSLGLRIYCAWHIPRAKQLMNDMSQLRALRPFDDHIHNLITEYGFRAADPDHCNFGSCDYMASVGSSYAPQLLGPRARWLFDHTVVPLGFHQWICFARLEIKSGRLASFGYSIVMMDRTGFGAGAWIDGRPSLVGVNEDSPDLLVSFYPRFGDLELHVVITPEAGDLSGMLKPSFACVWALQLCTSGYDVLPALRDYQAQVASRRKVRRASNDPCPTRTTFERTRDSDLVWMGTVLSPSRYLRGLGVIRQEKVFKNKFGDRIIEMVFLGKSTQIAFKEVLPTDEKVIVFGSEPECNVISASPENLAEVEKTLAAHPATHFVKPMPQIAPMPTWHIPAGLR
jgi:hypothetical protein